MESPRRCLAEISPITQRTASMMLDLPQPFGPTTPVRLPGKLTAVGSTNDLNPANLILLSRIAPRVHRRGMKTGRSVCETFPPVDALTGAERAKNSMGMQPTDRPVRIWRGLYNRAPLWRTIVRNLFKV